MKVSIIVPVYRTERTLTRCVESLLAQTFDDWEAWLIDDGSDDGAPALCDRFAARDERIHVVHQKNAGLSAARNAGLDRALGGYGEYILFVDSDDFLAPDTLAAAVEAMDHAGDDVKFVEFPIDKWWNNRKKRTVLTFPCKTVCSGLAWWFEEEGYTHCYAWNKLFRHKRLMYECISPEDPDIKEFRYTSAYSFREGKKFEDVFYMLDVLNVLRFGGKSISIDRGMYFYTDNAEGITANAGPDLRDLLEAHVEALDAMQWKRPDGVSPQAFRRYLAHVLNIQIDVERRTSEVLLPPLPSAGSPKLLGQRVLGMDRFCRLYNFIVRLCKPRRS